MGEHAKAKDVFVLQDFMADIVNENKIQEVAKPNQGVFVIMEENVQVRDVFVEKAIMADDVKENEGFRTLETL